jgi:agmatine deiminase
MPGEYKPHTGTIMIYPTRPGSWGKDRSDTLKSFGQVYLEIMKREQLHLLVEEQFYKEASDFVDGLIEGYAKKQVSLHVFDSDDAWARDVGPTFVTDGKGNIRGVNWSFNAWGGRVDGLYASWDKDDKVAGSFCKEMGYDYYDAAPFVLEGGSIHSDGEGTVMVTQSCLLSAGRNPDLTKEQIEDKLKRYLGAKKILWLPRGIYNDETNEHVDNACAFIKPGEVVLAWTDDKNDPQYEMSLADLEYLESETDARGRKLKVHKLPIPDHPVLVCESDLANYEFEEGEDTREVGERLAASYVNFYFINGAVLVPRFGGDNAQSDERAVGILKELCPDREIIGIDARPILLGGGNIHCITQQIPAGRN